MDYQRLIIRHLSGETSQEEEECLQVWLYESEEHRQEYASLKEAWGLSGSAEKLPDAEHLYQRIETKIQSDSLPLSQPIPYLRIAAAITFIIMLAGGYLLWNLKEVQTEWQTVSTQKGEKRQVILPDGTTVWLNTESSIYFPEQFRDGKRQVKLDGEAFFDVKRDTLSPFIIELAEGSIRVLGTSFNVKAYEGDNTVETYVRSGRVAFSSPDSQHVATLIEPQQKLSYTRTDKSIIKENIEDVNSLAWMENKIVFEASSLAEIADELERYFDIDITFEHELLQQCSMTGVFGKDSYREILNTLSMTNAFKYRENGKQILIYGKGCQ